MREKIKFISPGDMLYKDDTLKCWFSFMESKNILRAKY